jgi:F-type H+-transporting ATPase subunit epsilon
MTQNSKPKTQNLKEMNITVLTPDKEIFKGAITSVKVPGAGGQFQVLKNHAAIVSALTKGDITLIKEGGEKMKLTIEKGFIEVLNNEVSLLVQGVK